MAKPPAMRLTGEPVSDVLARIADQQRQADADALVALMREVTAEELDRSVRVRRGVDQD